MKERREWNGDFADVKCMGRTYAKDGIRFLALSGSGIEFSCVTDFIELTFVGDSSVDRVESTDFARYAIYIDDELVYCDLMTKDEKTVTVFDKRMQQGQEELKELREQDENKETTEKEELKEVTVRILKISEAVHSMIGIKRIKLHSECAPKKTNALSHKIEFIGDSITCGYGVDAENELCHFTTATENVTKGYAYLTAKALQADYSMVSYSGYGIVSGYTENDIKDSIQIVPRYYESVARCFGTYPGIPLLEKVSWDFSAFEPELIVINLGTNDRTYCKERKDRQIEYRDAYVTFLKVVRENNKAATILCTLGLMGASLYPMLEEAVNLYQAETKDENVFKLKLTEQDGADGYGADWHPSVKTQQKAALQVIQEIKNIMGW